MAIFLFIFFIQAAIQYFLYRYLEKAGKKPE